MKIETTPFVTTVTDAGSLFEIYESRDRLGTPCMLLVFLTDGFFSCGIFPGSPSAELAFAGSLFDRRCPAGSKHLGSGSAGCL